MRALAAVLVLALAGCEAPGGPDDPRDRVGGDGPPTWRLVAQGAEQAAFLSRPGAAPDLVLWCRGDGVIRLRAHVFDRPGPAPGLVLVGPGGQIVFEGVRAQGAIRDGGRTLVEGAAPATPEAIAILTAGASAPSVSAGPASPVWTTQEADPDAIIPGFAQGCAGGPAAAADTGKATP